MSTKKKASAKHASNDARFAHAAKLLDEVANVLALTSPGALTAKQRRQVTRARKGAEKVIPTIAALATAYGFDLPQQPTSEMTSNIEHAMKLEPLRQKLVALLTLVSESAFHAKGASWATATTLYGLLKRTAHRDSQLGSQLAPIAAVFAYRPSSKRGADAAPRGKNGARAAVNGASPSPTVIAPAPATSSASSKTGSNGGASNGAASSLVGQA